MSPNGSWLNLLIDSSWLTQWEESGTNCESTKKTEAIDEIKEQERDGKLND